MRNIVSSSLELLKMFPNEPLNCRQSRARGPELSRITGVWRSRQQTFNPLDYLLSKGMLVKHLISVCWCMAVSHKQFVRLFFFLDNIIILFELADAYCASANSFLLHLEIQTDV